MTTETIKGVLTFMCDACGDFEEFERDSFEAAWAELKEKGWRAAKVGNDWFHYCSECEPFERAFK
jgi:Fe2+ or Zn2+ uptake regulation protein